MHSSYKTWSAEEKRLFEEVADKFQNKYKEYSKFFPNRTYNQIKSYYNNRELKKLKNNFLERGKPKKVEKCTKSVPRDSTSTDTPGDAA